jgi:hypothetical protein
MSKPFLRKPLYQNAAFTMYDWVWPDELVTPLPSALLNQSFDGIL